MNKNKIYESVKMKIAISNLGEEDLIMNNKKINIGKRIGIVACILFATTGVGFATPYLVNKFGSNSSEGVQVAVNNQYISEVNTNYQTSEGISISINSFLIDAFNFDMSFNIKLDNEKFSNVNEIQKLDIVDLKVVNENGQKIFATQESENEEIQTLYKTIQEAQKNYDSYKGSYSKNIDKISENEMNFYLTATGNPIEFPKSKKLKVTFNKIRIRRKNEEEELIYKGNWSFDLDVSEEMYDTQSINYIVKDISNNKYKVEKALLSNTAFRIYLSNYKDIKLGANEYVETADRKIFYTIQRSDGDCGTVEKDGEILYYNTFNLTIYDATDRITVHLFDKDGEEIIINLQKYN